ncbi:MAG: hypothetical protein GY767_22625 [Shimia sp.]|nr:hypothetical protein [Shimia sp.]
MSLIVPTTAEVRENILAQLESALGQVIPLLPKSFLRVIATALAGVVVTLYKYGGFVFLQMFVATATAADTMINGRTVSPLRYWGRLVGLGEPAAAIPAELTIDITVTYQTGFIPSYTPLLNTDNGVTYITIGSTTLDADVVEATVRATGDQSGGNGAGDLSNLGDGAELSFANPLPNVVRTTVVTGTVTTGADGESEDAYRARIADRFAKRPQGGAYSDYEQWAEESSAVLNAYPYTGDCPGQVDVYIESATEPDGIPTTAQLQEALDSINQADRRPAGALVNTYPIDRIGYTVEVVDLEVDETAQVQADITTAVEQYFLDREPYIVGLSIPPKRSRIARASVSGVVDDVVSAAGGDFANVLLKNGGVLVDRYELQAGEKAKASSVVFI